MTRISTSSLVRRETDSLFRGKPIIIELHAKYLTLRTKRSSHTVSVDYESVLTLGYKILARQQALEKAQQALQQKRVRDAARALRNAVNRGRI